MNLQEAQEHARLQAIEERLLEVWHEIQERHSDLYKRSYPPTEKEQLIMRALGYVPGVEEGK